MGNDRSELHKKVEIRQKELQKVLANAEREGHPAKRIEALRTELSVVENATTGGWDKMAEVGFVRAQHVGLLIVDTTLEGLLDKMAAFVPATTITQIGAKDL